MKPTSRSCHATRILLELAQHEEPTPMRASVLCVAVGISIKLLEKIVRPLRTSGLIRSVRGATGGYVLGRKPQDISLADVLTTMEGAVFKPQCCETDAECLLMEGCATGSVWIDIARHMEAKFRATSLADFLAQSREKCPSRVGRVARASRERESAAAGLDPARSWGRARISRRRKPGSGSPAPRPFGRPRLV